MGIHWNQKYFSGFPESRVDEVLWFRMFANFGFYRFTCPHASYL